MTTLRVSQVDLSSVKARLARKKGWWWRLLYDADAVERQYRAFLQRKVDDPDALISPPSQAVDDMWHEHILDTKKYREDCMALFGKFMHHVPADADSCDTCQGGCRDCGMCGSGSCY